MEESPEEKGAGWQELGWEGSVTREGGDIPDPVHLGLREAQACIMPLKS